MNCILKHDLKWLVSLPQNADRSATVLLIGGNGHQVAVPASILLATSTLVRNILTDLLPPAYSQCCFSIPAATGDSLQLVAEILTTGAVANNHEESIEIIKQVLGMLGVEALLDVCSLENKKAGSHLGGIVEVLDNSVLAEGRDADIKVEVTVTLEEKDSSGLGDHKEKTFNLDDSQCFKSAQVSDNRSSQGVQKGVLMPHIASKYNKIKIPCKLYKKRMPCNPCPLKCAHKSDIERRIDSAHKKVELSVVASKMYERKDVDGKRLCWQCTECDYASKKKDHVLKHVEQIHSGLNFQCDLCQAIFHRRDVLRDHVKKMHTCIF